MDLTGIGSVTDFAKGVMDRFWPEKMDDTQRAAAELQLVQAVEAREAAILDTQKSVIIAEMQQSDNYTKRARPSIVYFGLLAIGLVHILLPITAWIVLMVTDQPLSNMPDIELPGQFWMTWGGVCSIWIVGRSAEKRGVTSKVVSAITGGR